MNMTEIGASPLFSFGCVWMNRNKYTSFRFENLLVLIYKARKLKLKDASYQWVAIVYWVGPTVSVNTTTGNLTIMVGNFKCFET